MIVKMLVFVCARRFTRHHVVLFSKSAWKSVDVCMTYLVLFNLEDRRQLDLDLAHVRLKHKLEVHVAVPRCRRSAPEVWVWRVGKRDRKRGFDVLAAAATMVAMLVAHHAPETIFDLHDLNPLLALELLNLLPHSAHLSHGIDHYGRAQGVQHPRGVPVEVRADLLLGPLVVMHAVGPRGSEPETWVIAPLEGPDLTLRVGLTLRLLRDMTTTAGPCVGSAALASSANTPSLKGLLRFSAYVMYWITPSPSPSCAKPEVSKRFGPSWSESVWRPLAHSMKAGSWSPPHS